MKESMSPKIISTDNYVFFLAVLCSISVCYFLFGLQSLTLAMASAIFTFTIHSAKANNGNYLYTLLWIFIILLGGYIGFELKLSIAFYFFLFFVSTYYYISFNKDPFSDRAIPFLVIFSCLGTTLGSLTIDHILIPFLIGVLFSLIVLRVIYKSKLEFTAFRSGLFSKSLYVEHKHVIISSFVYSIFLFLCLFLPDHFGLTRVYWAPMTFVILLKPKDKATIQDTLARFGGSAIAALFVIVICSIKFETRVPELIIILICVFLYPTALKANKLVKAFGTTTLILLMIEYSLFWNNLTYSILDARVYETLIGGCFAVFASFVLNFIGKYRKK